METLFRIALAIHIAAGTAAVLVGWIPIVSAKPFFHGAAPKHRRFGRFFAHAMKVVVGSAILMTFIHPNAYFAGLTASAGLVAFSGIRVLQRKRPDVDRAQRATWLDWLVTILALAVSVSLMAAMANGTITTNTPVVASLAYGTAAYAVWDMARFLFPTVLFSANLWLYEHIVKIIGAYFAAVAAFSGSVLTLFPEPWRQLWATNLGALLAIAMVVRYRRKLKRNALEPGLSNAPDHRLQV